MSRLQIHSYEFEGPPYLGFSASYDVWGDGSIVLVPAPGHTPGSIVVFITLQSGKRYALIGDLTWQLDGIEKLYCDLTPEEHLAINHRRLAVQDLLPHLEALAVTA